MDLKELEANPKLLSLLLAHYNALDDLYDHCEKASNWDHENNDCKVPVACL